MNNVIRVILALLIFTSCNDGIKKYHKLVNPFIGTGGHGHTYPGVSAPFGMVQLSPDTRVVGWDACSGYHYSDSTILGFSHTHLSGTGAADYGDILLTPGYQGSPTPLAFNHNNENAWAGYYEVRLNNGISAKLTSTDRVGIHQYEFANDSTGYITINLEHGIGPDNPTATDWLASSPNEISGYRFSSGWAKDQRLYFVAQFSIDPEIKSMTTDSTKVILSFNSEPGVTMVKVGLSAVSVENARENIATEAPHWNFNKYVKEAELRWDKELSKIEADFYSEDTRITFYTALYHSLLAPNTSSDVNGEYQGMDKENHTSDEQQYTVFSLWDTFRATHPLFTLINQQRNVEMINSMLNMHDQSGLLPVWELAANETGTMIGYHAIPVIADAIMKDTEGIDYEKALSAMINSSIEEHLGLKYYKEMGFIPAEKEHESVSKTLEYAYDDWCIAQVADKLGKEKIAADYLRRAQFYKNLYDKQTGFMRPKRNSNWLQEFDPYEVSGNYTEANAWQYNLFVPHDLDGLNRLYAPKSNLETKLDELFTANTGTTGRHQPDIDGMIGQYAHGNEPSHNFAYLYSYTDSPWKSAPIIENITRELYSNAPNGLSGNEDCGQMSSWYVFSSIGFYPVIPGSNEYVFGTPSIKKAIINLENGNSLYIKVNNSGENMIYIQSVKLNGEELNRGFINHNELLKGGELIFEMGNQPQKALAVDFQKPTSSIKAQAISIVPVISSGEMTFLKESIVKIYSTTDSSSIYYTLDGSNPSINSTVYTDPIRIDSTSIVKAIAAEPGKAISSVSTADFIKIPYGRTITLKNEYSHLYTGNSSMALIDHIYGENNFRDGWQGFYEADLEAVVDLGRLRTIKEVNVGFLQDHYSWIFYPDWLKISFSTDGKSFTDEIIVNNLVSDKEDGLITQRLGAKFNGEKARYVKVMAKNKGQCPDWHKGAGGQAWLFADEIEINTY